MKKSILAAVLFLTTTLLPFNVGANDLYKPEALARWAGCRANVVTSDQVSITRSYYNYYEHTLYIGTSSDSPLMVRVIIVFHEIGHCLQAQDGTMTKYYNGPLQVQDIELDADRRAADLACRYGLPGKSLLHDVFVWAYKTFGYLGDYAHGTISQRIRQGELASACQVVPVQAP